MQCQQLSVPRCVRFLMERVREGTSVAARNSAMAMLVAMNFSFLDPVIEDAGRCASNPTINFGGYMFLPRYEETGIRPRVLEQLRGMRQSGFDAVRTLVSFADRPSAHADWFDRLRDAKQAARIVRTYVRDVEDAGFSHVQLAFAPQAGANPACRRQDWGDCFDANSISDSTAFLVSVRKDVVVSRSTSLQIDLSNEACWTQTMSPGLRDNLRSYVRSLIAHYTREFPDDATTISCQINRFADGREQLDAAYAAAAARPSFYQIHAYDNTQMRLEAVLPSVLRTLADLTIPLTIGEVSYGRSTYVDTLLRALTEHAIPVELMAFWPLRNASSGCGVDVAPPYTRSDAWR